MCSHPKQGYLGGDTTRNGKGFCLAQYTEPSVGTWPYRRSLSVSGTCLSDASAPGGTNLDIRYGNPESDANTEHAQGQEVSYAGTGS